MTSLYLDVHVPAAIAAELRRRGVDVLTSQEDNTTELEDDDLLVRASSLWRLLFIGSIMFLGPGIKGDRIIGATDEKQFGIPITPDTLACDKANGIKVRPEHIHEALREFANIGEHAHSKKFPLGVPDKEKLRTLWG